MVYRIKLTYDEIIDILDLKNIPTTTIWNTLPPGMYEIVDNIFMLKSLLPIEVKVINTIEDNRLKSNLNTIKTIKFAKNLFSM